MIKKFMPKSLFVRTLLILVIPTILVQLVTTYVFYDRHWDTLARRLTSSLGGDIAMVVELLERTPDNKKADILKIASDNLQLQFALLPDEKSLPPQPALTGLIDQLLFEEIDNRLDNDFVVLLRENSDKVRVVVDLHHGYLSVTANKKRLFSYTSELVILWMVGSSVLLFGIAIIFLRNQIRPIRKLAEAAEQLGKGQDVNDLKPSGAIEIRRATMAFRIMRDRIRRQINQRTEMLAGISHDLRTPLTRLKLELALLPPSSDIHAMQTDIDEMRQMVDSYLDFARGDGGEESAAININDLLDDLAHNAARDGHKIDMTHFQGPIEIIGRPNAVKRALSNLLANACKYGTNVSVSVQKISRNIAIHVDDDGPGIPPEMYQEVFKPFRRLDDSRNSETGGVGLGLSIARDIARGHGGDITLSRSPQSGLRATIILPL